MIARFMSVVLPGDDHVLVVLCECIHDDCATCIRMQMTENKIIFVLSLCVNVFNDLDACLHEMMMVLVCKIE